MRLSVILLLISLAGVLGGAAILGLPALGGAVIFDSLAIGAWAVLRDDGKPVKAQGAPTVEQVLDRFRDAA